MCLDRTWKAIGLKPKGQRVYGLADGTEVRLDITTGDIEFMGEIVGGTIVYGEADAEPLLGVTALESVGIEVDPRNQTLKRLPTTRLKEIEVAVEGDIATCGSDNWTGRS